MTPGLKQAAGNAEKFGGTTASATEKVMALVGAMQAVPAAGFLVGAIAQAAQFDKTMTNIGAVMGRTKDQMQGISQEVLNIGRNSVAGPQAAAEAFYDIVGGVSDASTHMAILNAAIAASEAGAANLQSTTSGMISVMNSYKMSASGAAKVSDILTQTVGIGVGSMDQFVAAIGPISGTSAAAGVSFQEMASALAYMTTRGTSAAQSATQFKAATVALLNPNAQMAAAIRKTGAASGSALIQQYGLVGALNMLRKAGGGSMDAMAKMLGSVEALSAATALTGNDFTEFADNFKNGLNGATQAARDIQLNSFSAQFEILKNNLTGVAIAAGNVLLPALSAVMKIFNGLIGLVNQFDPALLGIVAAFTALGIAVPALLPLLGLLAGAIAPILLPIAALVTAFVAVKAAWDSDFVGIRTSVTAFVNDVKPHIDQISAGVKKFFDILNAPPKMSLDTEGMSESAARLTRKMNQLDPMDGLTKAADTDFGTKLKTAIDAAWPMIQPAIQALIDKFINLMKTLIPNVISALVGLGSSIASAIGAQIATINWGQAISDLWNNGLALGKKIIDGIGQGLTNLVSSVQTFLSGINLVDIQAQASVLLSKALNFGTGVLNNILSGLSTIADNIRSKLQEQFGTVDLGAIAIKLFTAALNFGATLLNNILDGLGKIATEIKAKIEEQFGGVDIGTAAKKFLDDAVKFGDQILKSIGDGITNTTIDIAGKITDWLNGINWEQVGKDLAKGAMNIGKSILDAIFPKDSSAAGDIANNLASGVDKASGDGKLAAAGKKLGKALMNAIGDALTGIGEMIAGKIMVEMSKNTPDWLLGLMGTNKASMATAGQMLQGGSSGKAGGAQQTAETAATAPAPAAASAGTSASAGASAGVSVGQQAFIGQKADATGQQAPIDVKATAPIDVNVKTIAPNAQQNQQQGAQPGQPSQPGAAGAPAAQPSAPAAGAPPGAAGAAGGMNPMDITLQSVQQKLQESIQWINTIGAVMLSEAMTAASTTAANAFKGGMASLPQSVILPVTMANLWVGTVGLAGAVGVFGALSKAAAGALTGIAAPIVSQVAEALIRIATMIAALPNGVGAQLAGQIRAAAGARAEGGPVGPGMWLVGEKGPELLQLAGGQHGQVISNKALRGASGGGDGSGGTTIILQNPQFNGVQDPETLLDKLQQVAGRYNLTVGTP